MLFKNVIGQELVKQHLVQTVKNNRISHAQLFLGACGYGTLALAIAYARYIYCSNKGESDSCGSCSSCVKFEKLIHPDLHFIYPVNTTKEVGSKPTSSQFLPKWREAVLQDPYLNLYQWLDHMGIENKQGIINAEDSAEVIRILSLKAFEGEYKTVIIWMAEKMNISAANKLLKVLEEPPQKTLFMLVCEDGDQLLPTILSRTQLVKVNSISNEAIAEKLVAGFGLNKDDALSLAAQSGGNWQEVMGHLDESENEGFNRTEFRDWMRICFSANVIGAIKWVDKISIIGREHQKHFLSYGLHVFRESLMIKYGSGELLHISGNEKEFVSRFSGFVHSGNVLQLIEEFSNAVFHIERNVNPKILFLDLSFKVMRLLKVKEEELTS